MPRPDPPGDADPRRALAELLQPAMPRLELPVQAALRRHLAAAPKPVAKQPGRPGLDRQVQPLLELAAQQRQAGHWQEAVRTLTTALKLDPGNLTAACELGLAFLGGNQLARALKVLEDVVAREPRHAVAHYACGLALEWSGRPEQAANAFRQVVEIAPDYADAVKRLAETLDDCGRTQEAITVLQQAATRTRGSAARRHRSQALELAGDRIGAEVELRAAVAADPRNLELLLELGHAQRALGRFDEAKATFCRVVRRQPRWASAWTGLVKSGRVVEQDRPLVNQLATVSRQGVWSNHERMSLHFSLGKALDDLNDYAGAMAEFDAANQIRAALWRFDRGWHEQRFASQRADFPPEALARFAGIGSSDPRPIFILGMPRSGTTLIEQILSSHPDIEAGGEIRFWNDRGPAWREASTAGAAEALVHQLAAEYSGLLTGISPSAARVTDKNPFNFGWIGLIHIVFPHARIIHCRRHPVDTCLSIYMTEFRSRMDFAASRNALVFYYRAYQELMAYWRRILPPGVMFEFDYQELIVNREDMTRRLVEWCGLPWNDSCLRHERNQRVIETASSWQARQPVYATSLERWRRYEPWLGELGELLNEARQ